MARSDASSSWSRRVRYSFAAGFLLLTLGANLAGLRWDGMSLVLVSAAIMFILGPRRTFRTTVIRENDAIICRYVPWYDVDTYLMGLLLPLMGLGMAAASREPGYPGWFLPAGIFLMGLMPLSVFVGARLYRQSYLRITPSALVGQVVPHFAKPAVPFDIRRDRTESVTRRVIQRQTRYLPPQAEINYHPIEADTEAVQTLLIGLQWTLSPKNLVDALLAWYETRDENPDQLLDRVERILCGECSDPTDTT